MNRQDTSMPRREFLKVVAAAGLGSILPVSAEALTSKVPVRPFGKTGVNVPILSLGGMFNIMNNQLMLRRCVDWGVTYWDTADCYEGGRSEPGFGRFFEREPALRKEIFLVTKSCARDIPGMTSLFERSLERLKTDYIDLYFIHGIGGIDEITPEMKTWVAARKKEGRLRLFGFSTHRRMEDCLQGAARLGWIDGIMFTYNYRLMHKDQMKRAVDACEKAGIGLTAMKTQGGGSVKADNEKERKLAGHFLERGFTPEQAKLKAVWANSQIACICSQMPNMKILNANIAAALDRTELAATDLEALDQHARSTTGDYCAGCSNRCAAAAGGAPISDVMRCLMYHHSYGDPALARAEFARLPASARSRLATLDVAATETACPNHLPIGHLVAEARRLLA